MTSPNQQDVAALVARLGAGLCDPDNSTVVQPDEARALLAHIAAQDAALSTLAAERDEAVVGCALIAKHNAEIEQEHEATFERLKASEARASSRSASRAVARAALKPFADLGVGSGPDDEHDNQPYRILRGAIRRARSVLEG